MNDVERDCPRGCGSLYQRSSRGIEVDLCQACGGIWLDSGEFDPLVAERFSGEPLEAYFALTAEETATPHICPHDGSGMYRVPFDGMELDWCPECYGIWIDGGERAELSRNRTQVTATSKATAEPISGSQQPEDGSGVPKGREPGTEKGPLPTDDLAASSMDGGPLLPQGVRTIDLESAPELELGTGGPAEKTQGPPGLRELDFQGDESFELELDLPSNESRSGEDVACASCGGVFPILQTMRMMDAHWCEACVVEGDYPGSHGPPVARRLAEAAQAMSSASVRLEEQRRANKAMGDLKERRRRKVFRTHVFVDEVEIGIRATARTLKSLFVRDD